MSHTIDPHSFAMNRPVLVTGCAGFIGWKVSELLLKRGYTVVGVDNLNDAYDVRLKEWRLSHLLKHPGFIFHRLDIADLSSLRPIFATPSGHPPFAAIINLAARAGVRRSVEDPWSYYSTNVMGTLNLLELCREFAVKNFLLASTSSVYGDNPRPFRENQPTDKPLSPYAASKKAAEELCFSYHRLYQLNVLVLRYFTVYGPAGRPDMNIFRFIKWIAEGEPVIVYGDGSQERDFTHIDDIASGTISALDLLIGRESPSPIYEVINLGSDRPVTLNYVISVLEDLLGKKARVVYKPSHPADVQATWADISKARDLLHWEPCTSLEEGLRLAVEWYIQNRPWAKEIRV